VTPTFLGSVTVFHDEEVSRETALIDWADAALRHLLDGHDGACHACIELRRARRGITAELVTTGRAKRRTYL